MDHRDWENYYDPPYKILKENHSTLLIQLDFDDLDISEIEVPFKYEVCDLCEGKGEHVNPSIDSHGLSREDFDEDPDFAENYFSGKYNETCYKCSGKRVMYSIEFPDEIKKLIDDYEESVYDSYRCELAERRMGA